MQYLASESLTRVTGFYVQPDAIRFPFRLPDPAPGGLHLGRGWVYLVSMETLEKMSDDGTQAVFLCDFPVAVLVNGDSFARLRRLCWIRIGKAKAKVSITGDVCGQKSVQCGFVEACALRTEAILVEVYEPGVVHPGDQIVPVPPRPE